MTTLRTFRAPDARTALQAVKEALGPDSVIVSTREVSGGLFRHKEIEITAAPSGNESARSSSAVSASAPNIAYGPSRERSEPAASENRDTLRDELAQLRESLDEVRRHLKDATTSATPREQLLRARLVNRGVEEPLADEVARQALSHARSDEAPALLESLRTLLAQRLVPARAPWVAGARRALAFVGPTGVGKTTTLAKIAARAILESKLRVALITLDTYRIGASEQVTRYGEIMRIPAYVAKDLHQLTQALESTASADLVLIDTAGRSVSEAVAKQAELLRNVPNLQLQLVLSAATGARQLAAAAERYRSLSPERLIFTKLDEAVGPGCMLSATSRLGSPVCAIADGQRVPEDLHAPTVARLFELVAGEQSSTNLHAMGAR